MRRPVKRILLAVVVVVLLGLLLPPFINVNRYRARIAASLSNAMGRQVTVGHISLRLLPQPGFELENLVVADDPSFSPEPLLRADEVTASLRISSLWRGRLEIARLNLHYASLNLVVTPDNRLNLAALLSRATRTQAAPTTAKRPETRVRFPYIEVDYGRINFKRGMEKQVFALTDTGLGLWSPWEDEWRMRIESHPVRTDTSINDTGILKIDGSFHRAENLLLTPININFSLERSQLGQLTKLFSGRDRGWRGSLEVSGTVTGVAGVPTVKLHASLADFRRYDIAGGEALRIDADCTGTYHARQMGAPVSGDGNCLLPLGEGNLRVEGLLTDSSPASYAVNIRAKNVPMKSVVLLAKHAKRSLPGDLSATGTLSGSVRIAKEAQSAEPHLSGEGTATDVTLRSSVLEKDLSLGNLAFDTGTPLELLSPRKSRQVVAHNFPVRLNIHPFAIAVGGTLPAAVSGWVGRTGYGFDLSGDAETSRLLQVARTLGIGVPKFGIFGPAHVQMELAGEWKGFTQPTATGTAQLKNVRAELPGIASPVQIASGSAIFSAYDIQLQNLTGSVEKITFTGAATFPRHCEESEPCISSLMVQADELDVDALNQLTNPRRKKRPWYKVFGGNDDNSILATAQIKGTLGARRFVAGSLLLPRFNAAFTLAKGRLELVPRSDFYGGTHDAHWIADFTGKQPVYSGSGHFVRAALAQIGTPQNPWGTGAVSGDYDLSMQGWTATELSKSATGGATLQLKDSLIRRITLDAHGTPLRMTTGTLALTLANGVLKIDPSRIQTPNGIYGVSGTAKLDRTLQLNLERDGAPAYTVSGTLEKPQVAAAPVRQAEATTKR